MQDQDKNIEQQIEEFSQLSPRTTHLESPSSKPTTPKPEIPDVTLTQWQGIVDLMAAVCCVPASLIMKVHPSEIEVLVSAKVEDNPYHLGEKATLNTGLYCETVMSTRERLLVPNALKDPKWDHNPDIPLGMICYLGYPLLWPDGDIFGTICILDKKENYFSDQMTESVRLFKASVESYLALLFESNERKQAERENERLISDLQKALSEVRKLSGFLPICASCKKIRDDQGYWNQIEEYISDHSEAQFSHGICPDCMRKLYPELADDVLGRLEKDEKDSKGFYA
jgi:hypothetical protein